MLTGPELAHRMLHALLALVPLLLTPLLVYALAEGWLDFGGGEKDVLLALPYLLWSLIFLVVSLLLIVRGWSLRRWLRRAADVSVLLVFLLACMTYFFSWTVTHP